MKTLLLFLVALITGCANSSPHTSETVVMRDLTSTHLAQPSAAEIIPFADLDSQIWNGAEFSYLNVSDVSLNPDRQTRIEVADQLRSNEFEREDAVAKFKNDIARIIENGQHDSIGREKSSIYIPVASQLNRLAASSATARTLFLYSDLMENESSLSFYDTRTYGLLASDPAKLKDRLAAQQPLADLSGITVYIIYQPETPKADDAFRRTSSLYRALLEEHGATVVIAANLTN